MDKPTEILSELPLFPLNTVLFPDGSLPLQIFEPRYLEMVARRHEARQPFGVVCLSEGREVRTPGDGGFAREALHAAGTLARIDEFHQPQPALMVIACVGTRRFRIRRSEQRKFGLWVAEVETLPDDAQVAIPGDLVFLRDKLRAIFAEAEREAAPDGAEQALKLRVPPRWNDCGWLANRWSELLPLGGERRQRLMVLDDPLLRLELVADALGQMGLAGDG